MPKFEFSDDHYRAITDLLFALRAARHAWEAARGKVAEWAAFADEIRRGQRAAAPLPVLIDEAQAWASRWRRRANSRNHRSAAEEQ
jgi:hypothetical protein